MSENCTHDCNSCGADCSSRKADFSAKSNNSRDFFLKNLKKIGRLLSYFPVSGFEKFLFSKRILPKKHL